MDMRPNRLKEFAAKTGEPIAQLVPRVIREEGSIYGAAQRLGVAPNTIQYWLKKLGLVVRYRQVAEVVRADIQE